MSQFDGAYRRWEDDCLAQYNERFNEQRKFHSSSVPQDADPDDLVEFGQDGSAYPHSKLGGTGFVPNAVTPWRKSPHYS